MTVVRARAAGILRVSTSDGQSVEITLAAGVNIRALDPLAAEALRAQVAAGELDLLPDNTARIDRDIDAAPRIPRPRASAQ